MVDTTMPNGRSGASLDDQASLGVVGLLRKRQDLTTTAFDADWEHIHGRIASRLGAATFFQMRQHHLGSPVADLLPALDGVGYEVPEAARLHGVSEGTFRSPDDLAAFVANPDMHVLMADEQNLLGHSILHAIGKGGLRTHVDRIPGGGAAFSGALTRFLLLFRPGTDAPSGEFERLLTVDLPNSLVLGPDVLRVRSFRFEPYGNDYPAAAVNVAHDAQPADQYGGALEIVAVTGDAAKRAFAGEFHQSMAAQPGLIAAVHAYPIRYTATLNDDGLPTEPALLGRSVPELARSLRSGATAPNASLTSERRVPADSSDPAGGASS